MIQLYIFEISSGLHNVKLRFCMFMVTLSRSRVRERELGSAYWAYEMPVSIKKLFLILCIFLPFFYIYLLSVKSVYLSSLSIYAAQRVNVSHLAYAKFAISIFTHIYALYMYAYCISTSLMAWSVFLLFIEVDFHLIVIA